MSVFFKVFSCCAAITAIVGAMFYRYHYRYDKKLNNQLFQRIHELNLQDVLQWATENIPANNTAGKIRFFPKEKSVEFLKNSTLSKNILVQCIYFDVVNEQDEIILQKVVLPKTISEDLQPIKEGQIYCIPWNL